MLWATLSLVTPAEEQAFKLIQKKMGKQVNMTDSTEIDLSGY
jgi:hypothetical protein